MSSKVDTSTGTVVKTDDQGRKLQLLDEASSWAAGFSYSLSWEEAMNNALTAVAESGTPDFDFELWPTQYVLPEPGTASVLEVGFNYTATSN